MQEIDSDEFTYWLAYYLTDPWGDTRQDKQFALLSWLVYSANFKAKKRPEDFLIIKPKPIQQSITQMKAICKSIAVNKV